MTKKEIAKFIDHTFLKSNATHADIKKLCDEALKYSFASVCVNPYYVKVCKEYLKDSPVKVATVVGFPLGATSMKTKIFEAKEAFEDGADEIDMVINIGALLEGNVDYVYEEIKNIVDIARGYKNKIVKVIIETSELSDQQKIEACKIVMDAGADFVKTSTGFSKSGAKYEDILLMRKVVGDKIKIKASGGIRTYEDALEMIEAGASRIGTSSGVAIVSED
ncbi:deoxyribose-phosphate aldolase [Caldicellulosiruptor saccharolyticus DSM 8903]|uniref:Deoxyribose-phosphate aldolase n=1 Tax=Caldicellulosiruptor saccharolyticus (strain ATCC 43494 / DSM 8903 / Tp8T 6331) TaxID=351627 RepID=DEOC_CALS8|nr:deoxyribose-phosphate aldolase [Caldicellulosiruptor saccharolyticus]A4XLW0.1 RecName: Full=Deoxyribose-phosphate aldolase; Short=DERA; AltName: Full=2-deoxy-D-ribose 5-phosphate aldolase; AltName: Full=Phosphodeoxyriboaldolase; Short=Deoxyriboaldolase [Caldicellulosiruptor saccharolyticus DSM 8903]ABP67895.1 deoxyribose-phosphate aldolase [Caldicellulosiruptor saccharolyticus DSM 8903]